MSSIHSQPQSIMVIDDEQELATLFKEFLAKSGYDVVSFTDPLIALEYFKDNLDKHSLIITDMRMPGMNGLVLAKNIRIINNKVKIFLITAFDIRDLSGIPEYTGAKIDRILQKPVRFSDLQEMIKEALSQ